MQRINDGLEVGSKVIGNVLNLDSSVNSSDDTNQLAVSHFSQGEYYWMWFWFVKYIRLEKINGDRVVQRFG